MLRRAEQLLRSQQRVVATPEYSVLRAELGDLELQEEDAPRVASGVLWYNPMT